MGVGVGRSCGKCDVYVGERVVWAHNGSFFFLFFSFLSCSHVAGLFLEYRCSIARMASTDIISIR